MGKWRFPVTAFSVKSRRVGLHQPSSSVVSEQTFHVDDTDIGAQTTNKLAIRRHLVNLVPGVSYAFSFAAINALGSGIYSAEVVIDIEDQRGRSALVDSPRVANLAYGHLSVVEQTLSVMPGSELEEENERVQGEAKEDKTMHRIVGGLHHNPASYRVHAPLIFANPRNASFDLMNAADIAGKIALVERGAAPFCHIVKRVQRAGALGLIILDATGRCDGGFHQGCVHGSMHAAGEGFAKTDKSAHWEGLSLPTLLVQRGKEHILAGFGDEEEVVM